MRSQYRISDQINPGSHSVDPVSCSKHTGGFINLLQGNRPAVSLKKSLGGPQQAGSGFHIPHIARYEKNSSGFPRYIGSPVSSPI